MNIGTRSVLYGAHCFFIHPWFVALAWWRLYGFRPVRDPYVGSTSLRDWRLWLAFFVHDLGYFGKPNMDGPEGEDHPRWGANRLFPHGGMAWWRFVYYHSRFLSRGANQPYSMLCVADKLAVALEPWWLYLPRVIATGEVKEYMALARDKRAKYGSERRRKHDFENRREWQRRMSSYCRDWAYEHRDGKQDTWTPEVRKARDESGVWA